MSNTKQWLLIIASVVIGVMVWGCERTSNSPLPADTSVDVTHPVAGCPGCVGPSVDKQPQPVVPPVQVEVVPEQPVQPEKPAVNPYTPYPNAPGSEGPANPYEKPPHNPLVPHPSWGQPK